MPTTGRGCGVGGQLACVPLFWRYTIVSSVHDRISMRDNIRGRRLPCAPVLPPKLDLLGNQSGYRKPMLRRRCHKPDEKHCIKGPCLVNSPFGGPVAVRRCTHRHSDGPLRVRPPLYSPTRPSTSANTFAPICIRPHPQSLPSGTHSIKPHLHRWASPSETPLGPHTVHVCDPQDSPWGSHTSHTPLGCAAGSGGRNPPPPHLSYPLA